MNTDRLIYLYDALNENFHTPSEHVHGRDLVRTFCELGQRRTVEILEAILAANRMWLETQEGAIARAKLENKAASNHFKMLNTNGPVPDEAC